MAFRASSIVPSDAYAIVKRAAVQLKINLQGFNTTMQAGNINYEFLQGVYMTLKRADDQFDNLKTTPGLAAYAADQENDQTYDVAAEFNAMQSAINAAINWLNSNIPTSVTAKTPDTWDGGVIIANEFTPAQTAGLRTQLTNVINAIE